MTELRVEPTPDPDLNRANVEEALDIVVAKGGGTVVLAAGVWVWPEQPLQWLTRKVATFLRGEQS